MLGQLIVYQVSETLWIAVELLAGAAVLYTVDMTLQSRAAYRYACAFDALREASRLSLLGGGTPNGWHQADTTQLKKFA